jgi:hypothetical protein
MAWRQPPPPTGHARVQLKRSLLLFSLVLAASVFFVFTRRQITEGLAEDHFALGRRLVNPGQPLPVFRPPGYPLFVAAVVALCSDGAETSFEFEVRAVQAAQCLLLAGTSVLLFLWMSQRLRPAACWSLALLFGINPLMLVLAGHLHYDVLHLFVLVLACYVTSSGFEPVGGARRAGLVLLGGVLFGVACLVRPMTLVLPLFVAPAFLLALGGRRRPTVLLVALMGAGMLAVVAPVTVRNHALTGRLIPVNAQGSTALWASTVQRREPLGDRNQVWGSIWWNDGMPIYHKVVGQGRPFTYNLYKARILDLEDEFRRVAIENIRRHPGLYARNVARNGWFFLTGAPTGMLDAYVEVQRPADRPRACPGGVGTLAGSFDLAFGAWGILAAAGLCMALRRKDPFVLLPAAVLACIFAAHALTYVDFRYLYVKVPFLLLFCGYVAEAPWRVRLPFAKNASGALVLQLSLVTLGVWTSALLYCATRR